MDLKLILKETPGVDAYRIRTMARTSYELFFVHRRLETVRATDTVDTDVTVYTRHDGKLGDSTFAVSASMPEQAVREKLEKAIARAKLVDNEPFPLPAGGSYVQTLPSNFADYTPQALAQRIAAAAFAADTLPGSSINALEVFVYRDVTRIENSEGVDKTQTVYHAMVEAIPTWNEAGTSVELYESHCFTQFDDAAVTAEIARKMREVRDRQHAEKPQTPLTCAVVLPPEEIVTLLGSLASDLNYSTVYSHGNLRAPGDDLQPDPACDKLTLTLRGQLPGSVRSAFFDADGTDLTDRVVIENGVVTARHGSARFAHYLGEQPTGSLACYELACGTLTDAALAEMPYLACVSLSGLQVDLYNDYIGGEIRLAYYHDGASVRPVTGISMSARLSEVLAHLRLSDTAAVINGYRGPDKLLMPNVTIV